MEEIKLRERRWLTVAVCSAIAGALSIAGIIFSILMLWYVPMALCIAVCAHGFYGCPFYFIAYSNTKRYKAVVAEITGGLTDADQISEKVGLKPNYTKKLINKAISEGYYKEQ